VDATQRLCDFVIDATGAALPGEVAAAARRAWLDTLGVALAGADQEAPRVLLAVMRASEEIGSRGSATVWGTDLRGSSAAVALVNGLLAHALDYDDVSADMRGHPSAPVLPAVLACRIGRALGASGYARGWHVTSVAGALGASAACASLRGLDCEQTRHALGLSASMAGGTRQNFGSMAKPLHAGLAARAGVEAAGLAGQGFTASPDALEGPLGFGALFAPGDDWRPERIGEPGRPWLLVDPGFSVKKYPCCYMAHAALDAALAARGGDLDVKAIESVDVVVPPGSISALIHARPQNGLEAKFSMEYCVATALLDGAVRLGSFEAEAVRRPQVQALLRRVRVSHSDGPESWASTHTRVDVHLSSGETRTGQVPYPHGDAADPLGWDEVAHKFRDCARRTLPPASIEGAIERAATLPGGSVEELLVLLRTPKG